MTSLDRAFIAGGCAALVVSAAPVKSATSDTHSEVVRFTEYTPLSTNMEMARRLLSPLTAMRIPGKLATMGRALADQPIELADEQFRVYVPRAPPAAGYGLLVFIPPWDDDHIPAGWTDVLESRGVIFVSGGRTGNDATILGRRAPLALLAAYNVMRRYKVDPHRVYISGFSGGSRVALRLAVGYPDLFDGALLDAGADPIGGADAPLPSRLLFDQFRTDSKIEYVAGALDELHQQQQASSSASLRRWCVVNVIVRSEMGLGHDVAPASALATALKDLDARPRTPSEKEADCWARILAMMDGELERAGAALALSDGRATTSILDNIDKRFGSLAAPRVIELARKLSEGP